MQYEIAAAAAQRLKITEKELCELAKNGAILGAISHNKSWLIPMDFKPNPKFTRASGYNFIPISSSTFKLGCALDFVNSLDDEDCKTLALAEYYYFRGELEKSCTILEPYFSHSEPTVKLAALFMYAFASASASHVNIADMSLEYIKAKLNQLLPNDIPDYIRALFDFAKVSIDLEISFTFPDNPHIMESIKFLPPGLRFYSFYLYALWAYYKGQPLRALGIAETALISMGDTLYPISAIYLHLISAASLMRTKDVDSAKIHFIAAMDLGKHDRFILPFVENYKRLPGLVESCFKHDYPEDYAQLLSLADTYYIGKKKIKNTDNDVIEHLTITELSIAMLAYLGWSNTEISDHMHLSENTIKRYLNIIFQKFGIRSRKELHKFLIK